VVQLKGHLRRITGTSIAAIRRRANRRSIGLHADATYPIDLVRSSLDPLRRWLVDMLSQTIVLEGTFDRTRHRLARRPARDSKRAALPRRAHPG
jgi:hypothetical protein